MAERVLCICKLLKIKYQFHLHSIGNWYAWLNHLKEEQHSWFTFVNELFKGFPRVFFNDKAFLMIKL